MTPQDQKQGQQIQSVGGGAETVRDQDKIMLVLAYLGILSLIPLLTVKDSEYVKWHAKQGTTFGVGMFLLITILSFIPVVNLAVCLLGPAWLVLMIMGIVKALGGQRWRMPLFADLSEKF
jgi:uncharacterized membrane protein